MIHDHPLAGTFISKTQTRDAKAFFLSTWVRLWNEIPCHMRDLPKKTFKRGLRMSVLNMLQKEDDYIQIVVIIKKVGEVDY